MSTNLKLELELKSGRSVWQSRFFPSLRKQVCRRSLIYLDLSDRHVTAGLWGDLMAANLELLMVLDVCI
jgi:hypothetical protein